MVKNMSGSSLEEHRIYGLWRVIYPDGKVSQAFGNLVVRDYAEMFGGEVVSRNDPRVVNILRGKPKQ